MVKRHYRDAGLGCHGNSRATRADDRPWIADWAGAAAPG
jgi:hypothetical protein